MNRIVLTGEQAAVVRSTAANLVVNAYAGTGKTTTLRQYALARPDQRILYLAFNKATANEAALSFPPNATCRTIHSLAYTALGHRFRHKLSSLRPNDIMQLYQGVTAAMADLLVRTVECFMVSADVAIDIEHVPSELAMSDRQQFAAAARRLWNDMTDTDKAVPLPHDGYLKLYQLSRPLLTRRHDIILLDEAQDTNPVTADIVFSQRCGKVLVGDRHQSIYGFRGSINAMDRLPEGEVHHLTQSMRFGEPVAKVASLLLRALKGERQSIKGSGVMAASPFRIDRTLPYAIICRTNASVFSQAVRAVDRSRIHFIGGVQNYLLGRLTDVHHLWAGRADLVKDGFYRAFEDFDALALYGRETADKDILSVVSVVKEYGAALPRLIDQVTASACAQPGEASVLLMTAHRSKGLEFDQVQLDDDFHDLVDKQGRPNLGAMDAHAFEQEVNLLYVALTRARHAVALNPQLQAVLDAVQGGKLRVP